MTITRETLELAAKAAGYEVKFADCCGKTIAVMREKVASHLTAVRDWNPEHDDGDSARMRTDLSLNVDFDVDDVAAVLANRGMYGGRAFERYADHNNDKHAALRYATLMVAAEIGRRMK